MKQLRLFTVENASISQLRPEIVKGLGYFFFKSNSKLQTDYLTTWIGLLKITIPRPFLSFSVESASFLNKLDIKKHFEDISREKVIVMLLVKNAATDKTIQMYIIVFIH